MHFRAFPMHRVSVSLIILTDTQDLGFIAQESAFHLNRRFQRNKRGRWGNYWDRHSKFRQSLRGHAGPQLRRKAAGRGKDVSLPRPANRDGHAMDTFELPPMKACMLIEDSDEHREFFG